MIDLHLGDCLDIMRQMPDNSIDALVTDPPAGIGFMGVGWDTFDGRKTGNSRPRNRNGSGEWDWIGSKERPRTADQQKRVTQKQRDAFVAWFTPIMAECLRVLKPGAHALVWALPRTSHWTGWALEEAGFEVRDRIAHLFGSGFPKSLDVSKAIDKHGGKQVSWFGQWLRNWREANGIAQKEIAALFPSKAGGLTGCVANWELGFNMPTADQFNTICRHYGLPFESIEEAEREVIGIQKNAMSGWSMDGTTKFADRDITAPATPAAIQWQGWGTALKPACEDWWLCRKPLAEGTVAAKVLEWGTGAINVDGCRVGIDAISQHGRNAKEGTGWGVHWHNDLEAGKQWQGRFPANVTHDGSEEVLAGFPNTCSGEMHSVAKGGQFNVMGKQYKREVNNPASSGSAARFFYCAKASRQDREEGCEGLEERAVGILGQMEQEPLPQQTPHQNRPTSNHHPTVKPTPLMRWLCRLITPPGGTVLDPFMGSGSTGKAAVLEGFGFIGIELDPEYFEIAKRRIEQAMMQPRLEGI